MSSNIQMPWQQPDVICQIQRLCNSFQHWTGEALIAANDDPLTLSEKLFLAPFVVVSHDTQADPIFNYGNKMALELWQMNWEDFTCLPSRCSAEPVEQSEREAMLRQTLNHGFFSNYRGVRISSQGERFVIEDGIIWNVFDEQHQRCGQAATFTRWTVIS